MCISFRRCSTSLCPLKTNYLQKLERQPQPPHSALGCLLFFFVAAAHFPRWAQNGMPRAILLGLFKQPLQRRAIIILHYWYGGKKTVSKCHSNWKWHGHIWACSMWAQDKGLRGLFSLCDIKRQTELSYNFTSCSNLQQYLWAQLCTHIHKRYFCTHTVKCSRLLHYYLVSHNYWAYLCSCFTSAFFMHDRSNYQHNKLQLISCSEVNSLYF